MKGYLILEEYDQVVFDSTAEALAELEPYLEEGQTPTLEIMHPSGIWLIPNTAFYIIEVSSDGYPRFHKCELPDFLKDE